MEKQVKTRQRVVDHGEVFTAKREVNAMLDLVKEESERIESRFLEPACGDGNFLDEILVRKLKTAAAQGADHFERLSLIAVSCIYGIELLLDNVITCRKRLFEIWRRFYTEVCQKEPGEFLKAKISLILNRNITCGNTLACREVDANGKDTERPVIFSEWIFEGDSILHKDYRFDKLLDRDYETIAGIRRIVF